MGHQKSEVGLKNGTSIRLVHGCSKSKKGLLDKFGALNFSVVFYWGKCSFLMLNHIDYLSSYEGCIMKNKITIKTYQDKTIKEAFDDFITIKKALNKSEHTIKDYENSYKFFVEFFGEDRLCNEIHDKTVFDYLIYMKKNKPHLKEQSVLTYIRQLRTLLKFFMENGYTEYFKISLPSAEEPIKGSYTDEEVKRLVEKPKISAKCSFSNVRDWALACYLLGTGNRLSTVSNVKIKDIDFNDREIIIRKAKNRKQQSIPLSNELRLILLEYLQYRKGEPDDFLFCNVYGNQLVPESIKTCIAKYNNSRGVARTSVHLYRHTFAKNWILNGGDSFRLKTILGHSTLDMVNKYVAIYGNDLKRDYESFSVLDQSRKGMNEQQNRIKVNRSKK